MEALKAASLSNEPGSRRSAEVEVDLEEEFERKLEAAERLRNRLSEAEAEEARRDPHARRVPRPCGLTIHTGRGCGYGCLYCYIWDMGLGGPPTPYPLKGLQLAYALAINPAVALGANGALLAFGSVTEPLQLETVGKTIEYLSSISRELGNPIQLSTKAYVSKDLARRMRSACRKASMLVTVVTLSLSKLLEPGAPSPPKRFESIRNLVEAGFHTSLFLRPILPGLPVEGLVEVLEKARGSGARGVVLGSLRVSSGILKRLKAAGYPYLDDLLRRLPSEPRGRRQITLREADLKKMIAKRAEAVGLRVYPSACAANIDAHELGCAACKMGPCGDLDKVPSFDIESLRKLSKRYSLEILAVAEEGFKITLKLRGPRKPALQFREFVKALTKREVVLRLRG